MENLNLPDVSQLKSSAQIDKKKPKRLHPRKKAMIKAMEAVYGNVSAACEQVGINRQTYYNWMASDAEFKEQIDLIPEKVKDFAETALLSQMKNGVPASTIFFLKTKAKDRGYIEETRVQHSGQIAIPTINLIEKSNEEIKNERNKSANQSKTEGNAQSS